MTFTDPTPPTADDNSPAAVLERTRQAYTDTGNRIEQLTEERVRLTAEFKAAGEAYRIRTAELSTELTAARKAHKEWFDMLPPRDPYRKNGTQ